MYKEIYTTEENKHCFLAINAHSGNKYYYFKILKNGRMETVNNLTECVKNDYYLDCISLEQLDTLYKLEDLFKLKDDEKEELLAIDVPF